MLLQGTDVIFEKFQPGVLEADLVHVNITSRYRFVSGLQSRILKKDPAYTNESYIMIVADEDELLQRSNIFFQKVQPLLFVLNLIHMNITGRYAFVTTR